MKIAVPVSNGLLDPHFGHCKTFALLDVNLEDKSIVATEVVDAPPHEPGLLPVWLKEHNVEMVIAGGLGGRAKDLLNEQSIDVVVGAPAEPAEAVVKAYLAGSLAPGVNACNH